MSERMSDEEIQEGYREFYPDFTKISRFYLCEMNRARKEEKKWHDRLLVKIKLITSFCDEREKYENQIEKLEAENAELKERLKDE